MPDILDKNIKDLFSGVNLRLDNVNDAIHNIAQGYGIHVQGQLSAFNFGHVQHIVDKP